MNKRKRESKIEVNIMFMARKMVKIIAKSVVLKMSQISSSFQNLKTFHYKKNLYNLQGNKTNNNHIKIILSFKIFAKKYNFNYNR